MMSRVLSVLTAITTALVICCTAAQAQIPRTINYQGYLTAPSGAPVNASVPMVFKLYDAVTGGNLLHTETQPTVAVSNGIFNVVLGTTTALTASFNAPYWLGVTVGTDAEMTPRQPLASSPYALRAASLDSTALIAGSQLIGSITTATIPVANVVGAVAGPVGPQGPAGAAGAAGATGPQGPAGPAPPPSLSLVTPSSAVAGRFATLYVIGEATAFDGSSTVNAGPGIFVLGVVRLGTTALEASVSVSSAASVGRRNVSVTTGPQTLVLTGGLVVLPPVTAVVTGGALNQGGAAFVRVKVAAGQSFEPTIANSLLVVGNATFTPSAGLAIVSKRWLNADTAELLIEVSPFASLATAASLVVNYAGGATDTASTFASVNFTPVTPVTVGGPAQSGEILIPGDVGLFSVAVTNAPVNLEFVVTPQPGGLLAPRVRLYPAGSATPLTDVNGVSGSAAITTNGTYTFSVVDRNFGSGFAGYSYSFALLP